MLMNLFKQDVLEINRNFVRLKVTFFVRRKVLTSAGRIGANVFQARAVPVIRKVKCTNVQRNAKMQNEQAWILLGVIGRFYLSMSM
jgi:hypothetical protein